MNVYRQHTKKNVTEWKKNGKKGGIVFESGSSKVLRSDEGKHARRKRAKVQQAVSILQL